MTSQPKVEEPAPAEPGRVPADREPAPDGVVDVTVLDDVWPQACALLPTGAEVVGSDEEWTALRRRWDALRAELPSVLDARPPRDLPDAADLGQQRAHPRVLGEATDAADRDTGRPVHGPDDDRSRLSRARTTAERARREHLSRTTGSALMATLDGGLI
jgi:hypothetical protein